MKLEDLANLFSSQIDAQGQLNLRKISQCHDLCSYVSISESLVLERAQVSLSDNDVVVTGFTQIFKSEQNINLTLKACPNGSKTDLLLKGDLPVSWTLSKGFGPFPKSWKKTEQGFLKMSDSVLDDVEILNPQFTIANFTDDNQSVGINLAGLLVPSKALGALQLWIPNKERLALQGTIEINPNLGALVDLRTSLKDSAFPAKSLGIKNLQLCLLTTALERRQIYESRLELRGQISTAADETPVEIRAIVGDADDTWEFAFDALDKGFSLEKGLSSLAALTNGTIDVDFLDQLPFLNKIALESLKIGIIPQEMKIPYIGFTVGSTTPWSIIPKAFKITNPKLGLFLTSPFNSKCRSVSTQVEGTFRIGQKNPIDILMKAEDVDGFRFFGKLADNEVIPLDEVISSFTKLPSLPQIDINQLVFAADTAGFLLIEAGFQTDWSIAIAKGKALILQNTWFFLERVNKSYSGSFTARLQLAGLNMMVSGRQETPKGGWDFEGKTKTGQQILLSKALKDLVAQFGGKLPFTIPKIELQNLYFRYKTLDQSCEFSGEAVLPQKIPLGQNVHDIKTRITITSSLNAKTKKRDYTGVVEGDLTIGHSRFQIQYQLSTTITKYSARWTSTDNKTLGVNTIAKALGITNTVSIPKKMDLSLTEVIFEYDATDQYFTLSARSRNYGNAFMTAGKGQDRKWGFVFGIKLPKINKLSKMPVVGKQLKAADFLTFEQTSFILSSTTFANYSIPPLPTLPSNTSDQSGTLSNITQSTSSAPLQIGPGLSIAAVVDLGKTKNNAMVSNLRALVPQNKFVLQANFGKNQLRLFAGLGGSLKIPTGKSSLILSNPALLMDLSKNTLIQIQGGLNFSINHFPIESLATLSIGKTEAEVTISVKATKKAFPPPPGIKGLHIKSFGVAMGVHFTPPGLVLGLQGKFYIGKQKHQLDDFAFMLEIIEEVPNPLFFSFDIKRADFGHLITLFSNKSSSSIVKVMNIVKGSDLSFYWGETVVILPDGTTTQPGFGFSGNIQILSLKGHAKLKMDLNKGIEGEAELSPINIKNILKISGKGKGIQKTFQRIHGKWQPVDNKQITTKKSKLTTRRRTIVPAGGAIAKINCLRSPFVVVNWKVSLLGIQNQVDALVSTKGFSFTLKSSVAKIGKLTIRCTLNGTRFSAGASFVMAVKQNIGPIKIAKINCGSIKLNAKISCGLAISLNPSKFSMGVTGQFRFQGLNLTMPKLVISIAPSHIAKLPGMIVHQIEKNASKIFKELFKDASRWAKYAEKGIITGAEDTAKVFKGAYKLTSANTAKVMKSMGKDAKEVAKGLKSAYRLSSKSAAKAMKAAKYSAHEVSVGLKTGYKMASKDVAKALKYAKFASKDVTKGLKSAYKYSAKSAAKAMKAAGYSAKEVNKAVGSVYKLSSKSMKSVLKGAGYASKEISKEFKSVTKTISSWF